MIRRKLAVISMLAQSRSPTTSPFTAHMCLSDFHGYAQRYASVIKLDKAYAMTYYFVMKYPLNQRISHSNRGMHSGTRLVMWRVVFTNQAQKDAKKLSDGGLRSKAEKLKGLIPFDTLTAAAGGFGC